VTPVRLLIWVATLFFVVMLFSPLVQEMLLRLGTSGLGGGLP
jgi:hypothetical protein